MTFPKGDKIACMSLGKGVFEIWTIGSDGANPTQVTADPGSKENPAWSPDGSCIAFSNHIGDKTDIYVIRSEVSPHYGHIMEIG